MKHTLKRITAIMLILAIVVIGSITMASAKTVKINSNRTWKYGSATCREYSHYYCKDIVHSARVTLGNGNTAYAMNYPGSWSWCSGWANANKSNIWNSARYYYYNGV